MILKWKLVNKRGKMVSRHKTKHSAQMAQLRAGRADRYVRKRYGKKTRA